MGIRALLTVVGVGLVLGAASATSIVLDIAAPSAPLYVGDHATLGVTLRLPANAGRTVLLTPRSEGAAIEVVRGRLMRSDARVGADGALAFDLPIVAQAVGTAVVRVHALAYVCERDECEATEAEAQASIFVRGR